VFPNPEVGAAAASFVCVRMDTDQDDGQQFAGQYHVTTLPTIIFVDPDGSLVGRIGGYQDPAEFAGTLRSLAKDRADYQVLTARMSRHTATIDDEVRLADIDMHRANGAAARNLIALVQSQGAATKLGHIYVELADQAWFNHDFPRARAQYARVLSLATDPLDLFDARRHLFMMDLDDHDYAAAENELHAVLAIPRVSETSKENARKSLIAVDKLKAGTKVAHGSGLD
jgi:thioredoxin-like negative regulator of GroEL